MSVSRLDWYFAKQEGVCYLQITRACREGKGAMLLGYSSRDRDAPKNHATWEHLKPRGATVQKGDGQLVLLACFRCNHHKGSADIATGSQLACARAYALVWPHVHHGLSEAEALKRCGLEVLPPLPIDLTLPVDFKLTRKRRHRPEYQQASTAPERSRAGVELHPRLPAAGYSPSLSSQIKAQRAAELGVTDKRFLPGAKHAKPESVIDADERRKLASKLWRDQKTGGPSR